MSSHFFNHDSNLHRNARLCEGLHGGLRGARSTRMALGMFKVPQLTEKGQA